MRSWYVFGTKFKLSVDLIQLFIITVWGITLRNCHKLFVDWYIIFCLFFIFNCLSKQTPGFSNIDICLKCNFRLHPRGVSFFAINATLSEYSCYQLITKHVYTV